MNEKQITNIACYRFAMLGDLKSLRSDLLKKCLDLGLKGTILLSPEGINCFLAGRDNAIQELLTLLRAIPGLADMEAKFSYSAKQPFRRIRVRIKKEIIPFGVPEITPQKRTSARISPNELKEYLDQGKEMVLLDVRNDFEIRVGTFKGALPIGVSNFRDFPKAAQQLSADLKDRPLVMFCTGGIRCEKAGPYLESQGFKDVLQLDGGILKYFEECGKAHFEGNCFVFDQRVGLDPALEESPETQCYACSTPLNEKDQQDDRYVPSVSCPYCYRSPEEVIKARVEKTQRRLDLTKDPLPGSKPYSSLRPLSIPGSFDRGYLIDALVSVLKPHSREHCLKELERGSFVDGDGQRLDPNRVVRGGERFYHSRPHETEPAVNPAIKVLYEDEAILIIDKPAPLPVHPGGRFNRNTLKYLLNQALAPIYLRPCHRLDANTTGLMVVAKNRHFAKLIQGEFEAGTVEKEYHAVLHGHPTEVQFRCTMPISDHSSDVGSRDVVAQGLDSETWFRVLKLQPAGTSLVKVRPLTGRTNQIRVHAWHLGFPILGDPLYLPDKKLGTVQTLRPTDHRMMLHASRLTFTHPVSRERVTFESRPDFVIVETWDRIYDLH